MGDTLVLNKSGFPIDVMSWEDAVTLYFKDRVVVVSSDTERVLRSTSFEMDMPTVIQLKNDFARRIRREVPFSRRNVAIRDAATCQYCGHGPMSTKEWTYDHVRPRSRGGDSSWKNLVIACLECNTFKANRTPEEAGMYLIKKPVKPLANDTRFSFRLKLKRIKPDWKPWAAWLYWNVELDKN